MRKLTWVLGIVVGICYMVLSIVPLTLFWLLGANEPFGNWGDCMDKIFKDSEW